MSTDKDMYAERENVLILLGNEIQASHYDSIKVGTFYVIPLVSGTFSIYKKTNLFDDELQEKVKTKELAISFLKEKSNGGK